ncbi:MAG: phosphate ABC transporter substrate-binding protein PstS family protein [Fimbriimonadales bacterium]|nr:phosphate ABC transporter substrate-binding protein PstS family protein [Fimbriimonadales bacterium]MDW8051996.1 phosphate ABC transporter substrate-binding protein PstS family protein [Armatimonadota bacterium]
MKRRIFQWAVALATASILVSCGKQETTPSQPQTTSATTELSGTIRVDGSSTVLPISEAVAEEFQKQHPKVQVPVGKSGTGGGFKKFANGEVDIIGASRPIRESEDALCRQNGIEYIEIPVAYDAMAVVVNPQNTWCDYLTVAELKKIWEPAAEGKIKSWSQVRPGFPDEPLVLFGAGTDSGTFDYFTAAIVGKEKASRRDYNPSEDDDILVQGVSRTKGALGYFGLAYYENNRDKLKLLGIDNGKGPVKPSRETVINGTYQPLSRPLFIYVNTKSLERPEVEAFVKFYIQNAGKLAEEVGYIALPDKVYELALQRVEKRITGSVFGAKGSQVGVKLEELYQIKEPTK